MNFDPIMRRNLFGRFLDVRIAHYLSQEPLKTNSANHLPGPLNKGTWVSG
jgi:hypothetical protein